MAFPASAGYGNLPNGAFTPVIYSQKVQKFFRKMSVAEDITNTEYFGEVANMGDTVKIIKEPTITVADYARGQTIIPQDLVDDELTLTVDQAKYFAFKVDDIEDKQAHINWETMAVSSAAYGLKDDFDQVILEYMRTQVDSGNTLGSVSSGQSVGFSAGQMSPLSVLNRLNRLLDEDNVPSDNRWVVASPQFWEQMSDENSKLIEVQVTGDAESALRNGRITDKPIRGFTCYKSNNIPPNTKTASGTFSDATTMVLAGHMSSTATASQIAKTEMYRDPNSFADIVRGLHLYGRKTLRPTALAAAFVKF
jgi:hypothetical protein